MVRKRICLFCGSSSGKDDAYRQSAIRFGETLAAKNIGLVYGGGDVGLMGHAANAVMHHQGEVIGVIPKFFIDREVAHHGLTELIVVDTMTQRKEKMIAASDGFIALPGGFGTLDELFEVLTLQQIDRSEKKVGLLNVKGYFDPLVRLVESMVNAGFVSAKHAALLHVDDDPGRLIQNILEGA